MPRVSLQQTNFTAGEISPRLVGRTDIDRYANAARSLVKAPGRVFLRVANPFSAQAWSMVRPRAQCRTSLPPMSTVTSSARAPAALRAFSASAS